MPTIDELMLGTKPQEAPKTVVTDVDSLMGAAKPEQQDSQFMRKTKSLGGGTIEAFTRRSVGLFRMFGGVSNKLEDINMSEYDKLVQSGESESWRAKAFLNLAGVHRQFRQAYYQTANEHDEFWKDVIGEYYSVEDPTFVEKVTRQAGELVTAPLAATPVGLPAQVSASYEEGYSAAVANGASEDEAHSIAQKYAPIAGVIETLTDKLIIAKSAVKGLTGLARREAAEQIAKNVVNIATKSGISGLAEGATEVIQDGVLNKLQGKKFLGPEALETFLVAMSTGAIGGGGFAMTSAEQTAKISNELQSAGMPASAVDEVLDDMTRGRIEEAQTLIAQYGVDLDADVLLEQLQDEDLDYAVGEYKVGARRLGDAAIQRTGAVLEAELNQTDDETLLNIATELGYEGPDSAEEHKAYILENKGQLRAFQRSAESELMRTIEDSPLTSFQKQAYKWMAQGEVDLQDVGMVRDIYTKQAEDAGYDSVDAYFEENQGTFMAPTKQQLDLFQQRLEALPVEDNPMAQRGRDLAITTLEVRKLGDGKQRYLGINLMRGMERPENIADVFYQVTQTRKGGEEYTELETALGGYQPKTSAERDYISYALNVLFTGDRNIDTENAIQDELREERELRRWSLQQYSPFKAGTAANNLYIAALDRSTLRRLHTMGDYTPSMSKWYPGTTTASGISDPQGFVGLKGSEADIKSAASHEAFHGIFNELSYPLSMKTFDVNVKMDDPKYWWNKAHNLASLLYKSPSADGVKLQEYLGDPTDTKSSDELLAMYLSNQYNTMSPEALESADQNVESLFREVFGPDFVEAMRMSREAFQARSVPENLQGQRLGEFYQQGRPLKSGATTIRGKVQFQADGKFVADLFKTGDVITLAHEFAHIFSPHMDQKMTDAVIDRLTSIEYNKDMIGLSKQRVAGLRTRKRLVWEAFQEQGAGHPLFINKNGKDWQHLGEIQEEIAGQFEQYLGTMSAPTNELIPTFQALARKYVDYYRSVRDLPFPQQQVDPKLAEQFDKMIVGDKALARRDQREEVTVQKKKEQLKELKDWTNEKNLKKLNPTTAEAIRGIIKGIDPKRKTETRAREYVSIKKEIRERLLNNKDLQDVDLSTTRAKIKKLLEMDKFSIYNMTADQINDMHGVVKDLIQYDTHQMEVHAEEEVKHLNNINEEFQDDNHRTWQWKTAHSKRTSTTQKLDAWFYSSGLGKVWDKYEVGTRWNPSRELEVLHDAGKKLYKKLSDGRKKQMAIQKQFTNDMRRMVAGINLNGVSKARGPVSKEQMVSLDLVGKNNVPAPVDLTRAQLMYFYGVQQTEEGLAILLRDGFRMPSQYTTKRGQEAQTYKFPTAESLFTALSNLTAEQRGLVDRILDYSTEVAKPLGNETTMDLLGVELLSLNRHIPFAREARSRGDIQVLHQREGGEVRKKALKDVLQQTGTFVQQYIEHSSFLQSRTQGESPFYAVDFFEIMEGYYSDLAEYVGMARPIRDGTAVLQSGGKDSTHEELIQMLGKKKADALADYIGYVEDPTIISSGFDRMMSKLSSTVRRGILKFKIIIGASQVISLNNYKNYLEEFSGVHRDMTAVLVNPGGMPMMPQYSKRTLAEKDPELWNRFETIPEVGLTDVGERASVQRMFGKDIGAKDVAKASLLLGDVGLGFIRNPDAWAISKGLELFERQAKRHGWSEEEMMERFMEATHRTQPTNDPIHTSRFIGKPSAGIKRFVFGIFRSATDNVVGEIQTAVALRRKADFQQDKELKKQANSRLFRSLVTNAALLAGMRTILQRVLFPPDEDEGNIAGDFFFNMLSRIIGLDPLVGQGLNAILAAKTDRFVGGFEAPLLKQAKDLFTSIGKYLDAVEDGDIADKELVKLLQELAAMAGSGWSSIEKQVNKAIEE
jgi:hypothetical protein